MRDSTEILVSKLNGSQEIATSAASALWDQADKNRDRVLPYLSRIISAFKSADVEPKAELAKLLGKLGTDEGLAEIMSALRRETPSKLQRSLEFGWGMLYEVYITAFRMAENTSGGAYLDEIICDTKFSRPMRAYAMGEMDYQFNSVSDFRPSPVAIRVIQEFADDNNAKIAGPAIKLLGRLVEEAQKDEDTDIQVGDDFPAEPEVEIDFRTVEMRAFIAANLSNRFGAVRPHQFEDMIARVFRDHGYNVEQTPYSNDSGADFIVSGKGRRVAVQVKRYTSGTLVGSQDINQVLGASKYYNCTSCLLITTSGFTRRAEEHAKRTCVELWNWDDLEQHLRKTYLRRHSRT
ncbi:MAG: restriction endonuclease [Tepidisphaeraceae bacterium]|jgi:hypothetical protein